MATKLKSALSPIPWFLVIKAAIFGLLWMTPMPRAVFALAGAYLYEFPLIRPTRLLVPFLALLTIAWFIPSSLPFALFVAAIFFILKGIKDYIFVERGAMFEIAAFMLLLLASSVYYVEHEAWEGAAFIVWSIPMAFFVFALSLELFASEVSERALRRVRIAPSALFSFLMWQMLLVVAFLPLNFFSQAALYTMAGAVGVALGKDLIAHKIRARRAAFHAAALFLVLAVVILSAGRQLAQ